MHGKKTEASSNQQLFVLVLFLLAFPAYGFSISNRERVKREGYIYDKRFLFRMYVHVFRMYSNVVLNAIDFQLMLVTVISLRLIYLRKKIKK